MPVFIITLVVGVICIILGASNMRGNISSLHSYHRHRVSDDDILPFGRIVGLGIIIIGIGIILFSILSVITIYTDKNIFILVGTAVMTAGIIGGTALSFYAMKKYNKGVF